MRGIIMGIFCFCLIGVVLFLAIGLVRAGVNDKDKVEIFFGSFTTLVGVIMLVIVLWTIVSYTHICPKCGHTSFDEKYCTKCGQQLVYEAQRCPKCNEVADDNAIYCYNCGEKLGGQNG